MLETAVEYFCESGAECEVEVSAESYEFRAIMKEIDGSEIALKVKISGLVSLEKAQCVEFKRISGDQFEFNKLS